MQKHNLLAKKIKRQILSINNSIENYFNQIKLLITKTKKRKIDKDNKVILGSAILVLFILSYFLIPTIHDKDLIGEKIKNQISNRYDIEIKFNEKINGLDLAKQISKSLSKDASIMEVDGELKDLSQ